MISINEMWAKIANGLVPELELFAEWVREQRAEELRKAADALHSRAYSLEKGTER